MKKVLMLTSRLPYPPIGGDKLKIYNLLKILSKHYKVYLVTVNSEKVDDETKQVLEKYTENYKIFDKSKKDFILSVSKTVFNQEPLQVNYYYFNDVQRYIDELINQNKFEYLFANLIRTTKYLKNFKKKKRIVDIADSIGLNYKSSIDNVKSLFWKLIYSFESKRLINYEKNIALEYDLSLFVNPIEIKHFNGNVELLQNGIDHNKLCNYYNNNSDYKNYVAFFGKMDYQPNIDAVLWFVENVLKKLTSNIKFIIVGAKPTNKILALKNKYTNIEVTGFVDDPYQILISSLCIVAPMQTGAGIQNKILETMALGTINIISTLASLPVGGSDNKEYLVIDDPRLLSLTINDIFSNINKYNHLKINSKEFILNNFTWDQYEKKLISKMEEIVK